MALSFLTPLMNALTSFLGFMMGYVVGPMSGALEIMGMIVAVITKILAWTVPMAHV